MLRHLTLMLCLATTPVLSQEIQVQRNIGYVEPKSERQSLDVYQPGEGQNHPIIFWIHGGGWKKGSKDGLQNKPKAFTEKGYVLVSTNYRFVPEVTVKEMTSDIAKAIRWTHDHAKEFGGDPTSIYVMGHSAGAHLAALICTDDRYLHAEGLSLSIVKGCVPIDVSVYDIPKRMADSSVAAPAAFKDVFGDDESLHRELSPVTYLAKGKSIPPFLILYVADRPETKIQSHWLSEKLAEVGVAAKVVAAEGKTHGTINTELGLPEDPPTHVLFDFLSRGL